MSLKRNLLILILVMLSCPMYDAAALVEVDSSKITEWKYYNRSGNYDSIIVSAMPVFDSAYRAGDEHDAFYAAAMIAQGYLFSSKLDSVKKWIAFLDSLEGENADMSSKSIYYNVKAIYALKREVNYPEALKYFLKGYEVATAQGHSDYRVALLSNITNIFYLRYDSSGCRYAQDAMRIVETCDVSDFSRSLAYIAMAQMQYLRGDCSEVRLLCGKSDSLIRNAGYRSLIASVEVLLGDVCTREADWKEAERHYKRAVEYIADTEPGIVPLIYLNYGQCCEMQGNLSRAADLYRQGLDIFQEYGNEEFRRELLLRLADVYCSMDDYVMFKEYYMKYRAGAVSMEEREREFNALLLSNQEMQYEFEKKSSELALFKSQRAMWMWCGVSLIALVLLFSFFYLWRKQKDMYRVLMNQYSHYMQQTEHMELVETGEQDDSQADGVDKMLFEKVKSLMSKDKIFRQKDITLDSIAGMTGSNRTYVSKTINHYAGQSFPAFLNTYRIADAVRLISDLSQNIPLKQVADEVGFTSMSVFYSAFCKETGMPPGRYRKELQNRKNFS